MNKNLIPGIFTVIFVAFCIISYSTSSFALAEDTKNVPQKTKHIKEKKKKFKKDITVSNSLFSFTLPKEAKGTFKIKSKNNGIFVYDKASKKAGFGGFAFGIQAFKSPSDYAMAPGIRKLGELTSKKNIYDIVLVQPTDVQFDYVNGKSPTYDTLYMWGELNEKDIRGIGKLKYHHTQGTLGEKMYGDILNKHIKAIKEKWDSAKLEKENMSYMYNVIAKSGNDALKTVGYTYYDVNGDGIEELVIGEIAEGNWKGIIYDIYTMVNREPVHVLSGGERNRYYVTDDVFICNEISGGADETQWLIYILVENSTELFPQVGFKYDGYTNKEKPWFLTYDINEDKWENVTEETFNERKEIFERYERFDFIPLKEYEGNNNAN